MAQRTCSISGCNGRFEARGMCQKHYYRWHRHGDPLHTRGYSTHGRTHDPNYARHTSMMARCYTSTDPKYPSYGGRGIRVHDAWHDVVTFCDWIAANLGPCPPRHSLDRINNDRGYEPGNVRWATASEQMANRRSGPERVFSCVVCGGSFTARRSHAMYCSPRCNTAAQAERKRGASTVT
jgi:hypothetical protein